MRKYSIYFTVLSIMATGILSSCDLINEPEESIDIKTDKSKLEFTYDDKATQYVEVSNYREYWECNADYGENGVAEGKEWIEFDISGSTLSVRVIENETSERRRADLIVTSRYRNPATIEIIQEAMPSLIPQTARISFEWSDNKEQKINIEVVNTADWTVVPQDNWVRANKFKEEIEVKEETDGKIETVKKIVEGITVNVEDNESGEERKSQIILGAEGVKEVSIEVVQSAEPSQAAN